MEKQFALGNITVYATKNADNDYTINLYNGSDCIYSEVYFTNLQYAIDHSLEIALDTFSQKFFFNMKNINKRLSENTYMCVSGDGTGKQDYFCRIDNTKYFKHYFKAEDEFIRDKNGLRIIDK